MKYSYLLIVFLCTFLCSTPQARIIQSVWGEKNPRDTRPPEEKYILFHTDMEDTVLQNALESPHAFSQRAGVSVVLDRITKGRKLNPNIRKALQELSTKPRTYGVQSPQQIALILSSDTDKITQGNQLAECFNGQSMYLLNKTAIFYAGKMGYASLLSQLSSKLSDQNTGEIDIDPPPCESISHYAQAAIDQINASKLPKEKRVKYLLEKFMRGQTRAREEVLIDLGEEAIPVIIDRITTSFINGEFRGDSYFYLASDLREMNISDSKATKALIPYLSSPEGEIRDICVSSLAGVGTEEAIPYLQKVTPVDKWLQRDMPDIIEGIRTRTSMEKKVSNR